MMDWRKRLQSSHAFARAAQTACAALAIALLTACASDPYGTYGYEYLLRELMEELGPVTDALRGLYALAGLALLLAGYKIYRFTVALPGFLIGAVVGAGMGYGEEGRVVLAILGLILGSLAGAALALLLHDLAVFLVGAGFGALVGLLLSDVSSEEAALWSIVIGGLIGGALLLSLSHAWIVLFSSAVGAALFGSAVGAGPGWMLALCLVGVGAQYGLAQALGETLPGPQIGAKRQEEAAAPPDDDKPSPGPGPAVRPSDRPTPVAPEPAPPSPTAVLAAQSGRRHRVGDGCQIGRSSACDLQLTDRAVSRSHAVLRYANGAWFLQDADSSGGTFVNGARVTATRLQPGDRLTIGPDTFTFYPEAAHD